MNCECITDSMRWFDWASVILLYSLGVWKMVNLINKYVPKGANWIIRKIENTLDDERTEGEGK